MTVLVTGAAGRIGRHVARASLQAGEEVRALVLPGDPAAASLAAEGIELVEGRLQDRAALERAVEGVDVIYHLAAALTSRGHRDDDFFDTNLRGTYVLLQAVRGCAPALRRLVFASSDAVYFAGPTEPAHALPIDETHPRRPGSIYGATKVAGEELCLTFWRAYGIPAAIMRPSATADAWELLDREGPFGRRLFVRGMIAFLERQPDPDDAARDLLRELRGVDDGRERVYVVTDPDGRPSTTTLNDARDAADGMRRIAASADAVGEAFNIGPAAPYAELELAERLGERLRLPVSMVRTRYARPDWIVSSDKARRILGYTPVRTIFDMLDEALDDGAKEER
jgi:UDP-glucose 4-epimerase